MQLSKHFTLAEATRSDTAVRLKLNNQPTTEREEQLLRCTAMHMEHVRRLLHDKPIIVTSWFRSRAVNSAVGGVKDSAHRLGYAVDFSCPGYGSITDICKAIDNSCLQFDQMIWEKGSWVHLSFDPRMRRQTLTTHDARTYQPGLPS